jgi:hypothetical protein
MLYCKSLAGNSLAGITGEEQAVLDRRPFVLGISAVVRFGAALLFLASVGEASGKVCFERTYGGTDFDYGRSVRQTSDGGYIVTGETHSFGIGWGDMLLMKVDSLGDTLWFKTYGGSMYDCGRAVIETAEGGYLVAGETQSFGAGGNDFYVVRTDSLGNALWSRTYGGGEYDCAYSVREAVDGYVIVGETGSFEAGGQDIYLVKVDFLGNLSWDETYGGAGSERGFSIDETHDNGYVIAGYTSSYGSGGDDMYLVRTDDMGNVAWTQTYGTSSTEWGRSVEETADSGFMIAGETRASGVYDFYLVKTDSAGNTVWDFTYGGTSHDRCMSAQETFDRGCVMTGYTLSFGAGDYDVYLVKTNLSGGIVWARTYGGINDDRGVFIQQTQDTGFIVTGYTESFGAGSYDVYLIKVGPDGIVARYDAAVLTIDAPCDTVLPDSTYPVLATASNLGNVAASFDAVVFIDGYSDTVHIGGLPPDSSLQVSFQDWHVPPVDSTEYSMSVCVRAEQDTDTTNDCKEKAIFAYNYTLADEHAGRSAGLSFELDQNRPNPFGGRSLISFDVPRSCLVSLSVFDMAGRLVDVLLDEWLPAGRYSVEWSSRGVSQGVYFYTLRAENLTATRQMVVVR